MSSVARHSHCVFQVIISCCRVLCIKEMKSALSMLYIVNRVISANSSLLFCFKRSNTKTPKDFNKCVECADQHKYTIL